MKTIQVPLSVLLDPEQLAAVVKRHTPPTVKIGDKLYFGGYLSAVRHVYEIKGVVGIYSNDNGTLRKHFPANTRLADVAELVAAGTYTLTPEHGL